ncbi:MAG: DUF4386 domain-containing protein [Actinomycetia bacterium]|nr:DUF4386 domain-containing protein [Actinomycetes bacterium]
MQSSTTTARLTGVLFIVATGAAIVGDRLVRPIRDDSDYLTTFASHETRVIVSVVSELILAGAVIGIAALLFPYLKRQHEGLAVGYVGARIVEGVVIILGGISSLLLLTLSRDFLAEGSSQAATFEPSGVLLQEAREWTDTLGTATVFGFSALILYGLMYRSELVPRWLSGWGFIGAVLIVIAGIRGLYGYSPSSTLSVVLTLPIGVQEMVLAGWLIVKGFTNQVSGAGERVASRSSMIEGGHEKP